MPLHNRLRNRFNRLLRLNNSVSMTYDWTPMRICPCRLGKPQFLSELMGLPGRTTKRKSRRVDRFDSVEPVRHVLSNAAFEKRKRVTGNRYTAQTMDSVHGFISAQPSRNGLLHVQA